MADGARRMTFAALALAAVTLLGSTPATGVAGEFTSGNAHRMRIRPVLAELRGADAPQHVRLSGAAAAKDAITSCDPARVRALRVVPSTGSAADAPDVCVVLGRAPGAGTARRYLLGPALASGDDVASVAARPVGKARVSLAVTLNESGSAALHTFSTEHPQGAVALTLDGDVLATPTIGRGQSTLDANGVLTVPLAATVNRDAARRLAVELADSTVERLVGFANDTTMTRTARRILGTARPRLDDKAQFRDDCSVPESTDSLILGCYAPLQGLFVLRVDRPDFSSVMMVTTAHEMLHAAYVRLPRAERARVDGLLSSFYGTLDNADVRATIESYPEEKRANELHSVIPTQVRDLTPELERYYRRYFTNRVRIVNAYDTFNRQFTDLRAQFTTLKSDLDSTKAQLDDLEPKVGDADARADALSSQITSLRNQGRTAESNDLVAAQNAAVDEANTLAGQYNTLVAHYNTTLDQLNALAQNELGLINAISAVPIARTSG